MSQSQEEERLLWGLLLCCEPEIGSATWRQLKNYLQKNKLELAHFWSEPRAFYQALSWSEKKQASIKALQIAWPLERWQVYLATKKWRISLIDDDDYPILLKYINDYPVALLYQGDLSVWQKPTLAVVGSRQIDTYGKKVLTYLLNQQVQDLVIVSGLMNGVDLLAHQRALQLKIKTSAFLGYGLDLTWPAETKTVRAEIIATGGVIMSEYAPWSLPLPYHFPLRNRLVAGSSLATLVIEATNKSGSLITANLALDYQREVLAVPGDITNEKTWGSLALIQAGAMPISSSVEILQALQGSQFLSFKAEWASQLKISLMPNSTSVKSNSMPKILADPEQNSIYQVLVQEPATAEVLSGKLNLTLPQILTLLSLLELSGLICQNEQGEWQTQ